MPALLIPVITSALATTALSSTAIAATAFLAANAIVAGAALGLSALLSPSNDQKVASQQFQSRQAMPTLLYGYGTTKLGGSKFAFDSANGYYIDGIIHCAGPVSRVVQWFLNDVDAQLGSDSPIGNGGRGGIVVKLPWDGVIKLESHLGTTAQGPALPLLQQLGATYTADHRCAGLFNTVMECKPVDEEDFQKYYPNGPPAIYVVADLALAYDPRDGSQVWSNRGTWKFTTNVSIAILHYLTAIRGTDQVTGNKVPFGFGFPTDRIDLDSFIRYANVCDEPVLMKDGTTEPRYMIGGTFDMGKEDRKTVLNRLLSTGDAEIYQAADGRIAIRGGQWTEPTVTITPDHILGYDYEGGSDKVAAFNRLKISFNDPLNDYQIVEGDPWDDRAAQEANGGEVTTQDLSLPMVPRHGQARRLAKIATAKANPRHKLTLTTDLYGLLALGERIITVVLPELDINDTFQVTAFTEAADGTCKIGLSSLSSDTYSWVRGSEEGTRPAVANTIKQPTAIPDIVDPQLEMERIYSGDVVTSIGVKVSVAAPTITTFELKGRLRVNNPGDQPGTWVDMFANGEPWTLVYRPVGEGNRHEVQVAYWAPFNGTKGPWVPAGTIIGTGDTKAPDRPEYTSISVNNGKVVHEIVQSPSANARAIQLFRAEGFGKIFSEASLVVSKNLSPNQPDTLREDVALGYRSWWLRALNGSNTASVSVRQTLLYTTQPGNLTPYPNDLTDTSWVKTGLSPAINGSGPDGATATRLVETTATGRHQVSYAATGLPTNGNLQGVWGVAADGRTKGRVELMVTSGSGTGNYVSATFDLTLETATIESVVGSNFSEAVVSLRKVSADYYLVVLYAKTTGVPAARSTLSLRNDDGTLEYAGNPAKAMLAWACTLARVV